MIRASAPVAPFSATDVQRRSQAADRDLRENKAGAIDVGAEVSWKLRASDDLSTSARFVPG